MDDKKLEELAKSKVDRILRRGLFNSGLLAVTFLIYVAQGYASGSYLMVGIGSFAVLGTVNDCFDFYQLRKSLSVVSVEDKNG